MEEQKISTAFSDDGQMRLRRDDFNGTNSDQPEQDGGVSMTAEFSDHHLVLHHVMAQERPDEDDAIYELPNESEGQSLPGSIRDRQDAMSENIQAKKIKNFGQGNKPFTVKPQEDLSDVS